MAEIKLFDINLDDYRSKLQSLRQELADLSQGTDEYNQKQQELADTTNELSNAVSSSNPSMQELKATMSQLKQEWANANDEAERGAIATQIGIVEGNIKTLNQELKNTAQDAAAAEGSYNELVVKLRELQQAAKATGDAAERMELSRQANEINDQLKGMDAEMGNFQRNVGSYENSITSAFGQIAGAMGPVAKGAGGIGKAIGGLDAPIKMAVGAIGGLSKAFKALKAAMASNPIGLAVTAIVAAGAAIYKHIKSVQAAEEEYKKWKKSLTDVSKESKEFAREEQVRSEVLFNAAIKAKKGTDERKKAVQALQKQYPAYFGNMNAEIATNEQLQKAYRQLAADILKAAEARAQFEKLKDLYKQRDDLEEERENTINDYNERKAKFQKNSSKGVGYGNVSGSAGAFGTSAANANSYDRDRDNAVGAIDRKLGDVNKGIDRIKNKLQTKDLNIDVNKDPGTRTTGGHKGGSSGGSHKGGSGGHKGGSGEVVDKETQEFNKLKDAYEDFIDTQKQQRDYTLEMLDQNIGAATDFENRAQGAYDETADFEIQQLERRKKASDDYYLQEQTATQQYLDRLKEMELKAEEDLKNAKTDAQKAAINERLALIRKEQDDVTKASKLAQKRQLKLQYDTDEQIGEIQQQEQDDRFKKLQEWYDLKNKQIEEDKDSSIGLLQQQLGESEALNDAIEAENRESLVRQIEIHKKYIAELIALYGENAPIVQSAMKQLNVMQGQLSVMDNKTKAQKEQKDHIRAAVETAQAIGDLTSSIADYWKSTTQAQLEAG